MKRSGVGVGRGVRGSGLLGGSQRDVLSSIPSTIYLVKWYIARSSSQVKKKKKNNLQVQNGYLLYQMSEPTRPLLYPPPLSPSVFVLHKLSEIYCLLWHGRIGNIPFTVSHTHVEQTLKKPLNKRGANCFVGCLCCSFETRKRCRRQMLPFQWPIL